LQEKLAKIKHQLGETAVEKLRLELSASKDTKVKSALSKRIQVLEKTVEAEQQQKDLFRANNDAMLKALENQIRVLEDINSSTAKEKEIELGQLKNQKKVLVKEVKTLRQDLTRFGEERDEAQKQLDALQNLLHQLIKL
jgi:hypothetical protein